MPLVWLMLPAVKIDSIAVDVADGRFGVVWLATTVEVNSVVDAAPRGDCTAVAFD